LSFADGAATGSNNSTKAAELRVSKSKNFDYASIRVTMVSALWGRFTEAVVDTSDDGARCARIFRC